MPSWVNPFTRHDRQEFLGVVVPLSEAPRFQHLNTVASTDTDSETPVNKKDKKDDTLDRIGSEENGAASNPEYSHQTIEAIRAEVESEISTSGHDTTYDRRFLLFWFRSLFPMRTLDALEAECDMPCARNRAEERFCSSFSTLLIRVRSNFFI